MTCPVRPQEKRRRITLVKNVSCDTPASPAMQKFGWLEGSVGQVQREFQQANELEANRQGGDIVPGTKGSSMRLDAYLKNEFALDWLIESAIGGAFAAVNNTVSVAYNTGAKTATRSTGSFLTDSLATRLRVGDKVVPVGSANNKTTLNGGIGATDTTITLTDAAAILGAATSGYIAIVTGGVVEIVKFTSRATHVLTVETNSAGQVTGRGRWDTTAASHSNLDAVYPVWTIATLTATVMTLSSGDTVTTEAAVSTTFNSNRKRASSGGTQIDLTALQEQLDAAGHEQTFTRLLVNDLTLSIQQGMAQLSSNLLGVDCLFSAPAGATFVDPRGNGAMTGTTTGTLATEDGSSMLCAQATIQIANGRNREFILGSDAADHISEDNLNVTADLTLFRQSLTRLQDYLAADPRAIVIQVKDPAQGDAYRFEMPNSKIQQGTTDKQNGSVTDVCQLYAVKDLVSGSKLIVEKVFG